MHVMRFMKYLTNRKLLLYTFVYTGVVDLILDTCYLDLFLPLYLCLRIEIDTNTVPYHIRLSPSFNAKINTKYLMNLAFSGRKFSYLILQNNSFFLNFLISPENRNLDPLKI